MLKEVFQQNKKEIQEAKPSYKEQWQLSMSYNSECDNDQPEGLLRTSDCQASEPVSQSGGLGWGLIICISDKLPGDANAVGPEFAL